jgi:large subunit ribosomal protein L15
MADSTPSKGERLEGQRSQSARVGSVPASQPANRKKDRVGRGHSAGQGKTCGRGIKGQKARNKVRRGFEGGQTPLQRRLPQARGSSQRALNIGMFEREFAVINVGRLEELFGAGDEVTPQILVQMGIVKKLGDGLRVLGGGELTKSLRITASHVTKTAKDKIEKVGGSVELI